MSPSTRNPAARGRAGRASGRIFAAENFQPEDNRLPLDLQPLSLPSGLACARHRAKTRSSCSTHAGNHLRLGRVTDIRQDHLDDSSEWKSKARKKEHSEPLPKLCDECRSVIPPSTTECSGCGAPVLTRTQVRHEPGELVELGARRTGKTEALITEKTVFCAELKRCAAAWGYASSHKFREKFGVWPNDHRVRSVPIAWANGRAAHG